MKFQLLENRIKQLKKNYSKNIAPFILRRLKKDVMSELPPKIEHKILVEMTDRQKKIYAAFATAARTRRD
ncbi:MULTISPECIES: SNF2-related protein [Spiroplasma]|uniref:SNF2-related protein n=1 Tax=Spiroplasma TaxID=2132 RepID=UPI0038D470BA|nr:hypothetical protein [Spiroplasma sp. hyd1]